MEPLLIIFAFGFGMAVSQVGLPPLVGFLLAGFALNYMDFQASDLLSMLAGLGVTLLLFSIGLKLNVKVLLKPEIWASASIHMLITTVFFVVVIKAATYTGIALFADMGWGSLLFVGFALSFSSTVFAVKVLEDKGEMSSLYGQVAIGILIMQDLFAVVFMTISKEGWPSIWAIGLLALPLLRPLLFRLLDRVGHGEVLVLCGLFLALVLGAELFHLVGLKADLGALIVGMLIASHKKSGELAKALFNLKELFLVAFFLDIGLTGQPSLDTVLAALVLLVVLPVKTGFYFVVMSLFRLRVRTSLFASLSLANYSEFGLIVAAIGYQLGLLSADWLVAIAIALSLSFLIVSPLNGQINRIYTKTGGALRRFQRSILLADDQPLELGNPEILVFGMGRVGMGCYDELYNRFGNVVVGIEHADYKVKKQQEAGRNVLLGDATDTDFWDKLRPGNKLRLIMLAMPNHHSNLYTAAQLRESNYQGEVAAIVRFPDEADELRTQGVSSVFNMYEEAGAGFAEHVCAGHAELLSASVKETP